MGSQRPPLDGMCEFRVASLREGKIFKCSEKEKVGPGEQVSGTGGG